MITQARAGEWRATSRGEHLTSSRFQAGVGEKWGMGAVRQKGERKASHCVVMSFNDCSRG
eukprot:3458002-Rhodomonas_salina.2